MYLRLAFAVAAHLEPEILIVDEVLAVGDSSFQKKCLGKMGSVAGEGRTVLFVSHNMDAIQRLCTHGVLLENGQLTAYGEVAAVVQSYLGSMQGVSAPGVRTDLTQLDRTGNGAARFTAIRYTSSDPRTGGHAYPFGPLDFELEIEADRDRTVEAMAVSIWTRTGTMLVNADIVTKGEFLHLRRGANRFNLHIDELYLNPGTYTVFLWLASAVGVVYDRVESALELEVVPNFTGSLGATPKFHGLVAARFDVTQLDEGSHVPAALAASRGIDP